MGIRILITDDERLVRAGFRVVVKAVPDIEVVGQATDGLEAVEAATTQGSSPYSFPEESQGRAGVVPDGQTGAVA